MHAEGKLPLEKLEKQYPLDDTQQAADESSLRSQAGSHQRSA